MSTLSRRAWLEALTSLSAMLVLEPGLEAQGRQQQPIPMRINKEMLAQALKLVGLDFTDAQQEMMLQSVNRSVVGFDALRKLNIPLDTEPAFRFIPALPGKEPKMRPAKFQPTKARAVKRPASLDDLAFATVPELAAFVKSKQVTSTELTKMYLARLKRFGPKLNCVITLTEDLALKQAAAADAEIQRGKYRGPLHGIPYGAKDLFATKGIKTTWGAEPFQDQVIDHNATAIDRLEAAGAVLCAKLSMGALAQGDLWFNGMTRNPWNLEQGSSGSSAGSASATSAGLVGFSIGTETLGSIVSPSTRCGVVGLRPTYGRVSRYGAMALSWTMDKVGPLCRGVEDCALVLNAMHGPDGKDGTVLDAPLDWLPQTPVSGLKIGYLKAEFDRMTGDRGKLYADALDAVRKAGMKLEEVALPAFDTGALRVILSAEAATAFDDITRDGRVGMLKGQQPFDWPNSFRSTRLAPAVEYIRAQRGRTLLQQEMDKFMSQWDVIVCPPQSASLTVTNMTGHPQVVVPCGFLNGKEPFGLMFTGKLYEEGTPLLAARAFEQATEWHTMHPKMDFA
ncbi:MAG: amidase [Bryobacteraceae bacterium]